MIDSSIYDKSLLENSKYEGFDSSKNSYYYSGKKYPLKEIISLLEPCLSAKGKVYLEVGGKKYIESAGAELRKIKYTAQKKEISNSIDGITFYKTFSSCIPDSDRGKSVGYAIVPVKDGKFFKQQDFNLTSFLNHNGLSREDALEFPTVEVVYDPLIGGGLSDGEYGAPRLNLAESPFWKRPEYESVKAEIPKGFITALLNHLFPVDSEREYILDWCAEMVKGRNETVLILAGSRGTGKSSFVELLSCIVGKKSFALAGPSILEDKFNSPLLYTRLLVFEEVPLTDPQHVNKIKAWCNPTITVESKGADPVTVKNWSNMIFLLNQPGNLEIQPQERRFSIPEVASQSLISAVDPSVIKAYKKVFASDLDSKDAKDQHIYNEIAAFAKFLDDRNPHDNLAYEPLKGEYFFKVCELNLSEWQRSILEFALDSKERKPIFFTTIFKDIKPFPKKKGTIEAFLMDYKHRGTIDLGQVVDSDFIDDDDDDLDGRNRRSYCFLPSQAIIDYGKSIKKPKPKKAEVKTKEWRIEDEL